jgi:hypothetical protein
VVHSGVLPSSSPAPAQLRWRKARLRCESQVCRRPRAGPTAVSAAQTAPPVPRGPVVAQWPAVALRPVESAECLEEDRSVPAARKEPAPVQPVVLPARPEGAVRLEAQVEAAVPEALALPVARGEAEAAGPMERAVRRARTERLVARAGAGHRAAVAHRVRGPRGARRVAAAAARVPTTRRRLRARNAFALSARRRLPSASTAANPPRTTSAARSASARKRIAVPARPAIAARTHSAIRRTAPASASYTRLSEARTVTMSRGPPMIRVIRSAARTPSACAHRANAPAAK